MTQGLRIGVPYAMASFLLGLSFGVLARPVLGFVATIVISVIVFAGSAQFAALAVLSAGGGNRGDGHFDIPLLLGSTLAQYPAWVLGTVAGVLAGGAIADPKSLGLDAVFPAFFLALLVVELQRPGARLVCGLAVVITLALIPVAPPGVPIIAAALAALLGVRR